MSMQVPEDVGVQSQREIETGRGDRQRQAEGRESLPAR